MTKSIRQQFNFEEIYHQYNPLIKASVKRTQIRGFHEDLMQAGYMALWKAYETHNPEKGPFPAYAKLCVSYELLTYFKSEYTYQGHNMPTDFQETYEERGHAKDRFTEDDFGHYLSLLSDKERIWAYEHCVNDLPPRMIAKKYRVSVSAVKDWRKRAVARLRKVLR
ncbi:hypothetical protein DH09_14040 [Bacillaceae bacterium JMAK1]|nr:hypothetical protein DH09_14040 [Bacillaceae bacterium JMAK1]